MGSEIKVPSVVLHDYVFRRRIRPFAFGLYVLLLREAGAETSCSPSIPRLMALTRSSRNRIERSLGQLDRAGLIVRKAGTGGRPNTYYICDVSGRRPVGIRWRPAPVRQAFGRRSVRERGAQARPKGGHFTDTPQYTPPLSSLRFGAKGLRDLRGRRTREVVVGEGAVRG